MKLNQTCCSAETLKTLKELYISNVDKFVLMQCPDCKTHWLYRKLEKRCMEELGAYICTKLEEQGIKTVLSGGACAEIYSHGKYTSDDIDLINRYNAKEAQIREVMLALGFKEHNRYYIHDDTAYFIEFPRGPLGVGDAPVWVAQLNALDMKAIEKWSALEGKPDKFERFRQRVEET